MTDAQVRRAEIGDILSKLEKWDELRFTMNVIRGTPQATECGWFIDFCNRNYNLPSTEMKDLGTAPHGTDVTLTILNKLEAEDRRRLLYDLVTATPKIAETEWFQKATD